MNMNYLTIAEEKIPNTQVLINLISYRTRQLNNGARPMVKRDHAEMDNHDIVLKMKEKTKQKSFDSIALLLFEQALIQEGAKLEDTSGFVARLNKVISETL